MEFMGETKVRKLTLFRGNKSKSTFSRGFALLPTLFVLFALVSLVCSVLILARVKLESSTKKSASFYKQIECQNEELKKDWDLKVNQEKKCH